MKKKEKKGPGLAR